MRNAILCLLLLAAGPAAATSHQGHHGHGQPTTAATAEAEGEIRRVDPAAGKVTIRHGPIEKFDMMGMSMVFAVRDPAVLQDLVAGDRVRFELESNGGALTVITIRKLE
ncbi:Cu/Ag efflux protein CusF [Stella humosa]|uniref:Cu/Ag efflux protein CusF n=1 Tax=Stella humosa TaxID=94 RepID=A0A3N1M1U7_9PROT|nr:copper-binding protein [Stella humosa]ROP99691.1 Cu/Ag efflux protein CusF [Stella humosa]BBK31083.1 hypothetical protein STHU_17170 [Stella humosa]